MIGLIENANNWLILGTILIIIELFLIGSFVVFLPAGLRGGKAISLYLCDTDISTIHWRMRLAQEVAIRRSLSIGACA